MAKRVLRRLRDRGLLELHPAGSHSYYTLTARLRDEGREPSDREQRPADRGEQPADWGEQAMDRGEQPADWGEPLEISLQERIAQLGQRPRKEALRAVIRQLCRGHWRSAAWLAQQLNLAPNKLVERHLSEMVKAGLLVRRFPATPTHADQAYREDASQGSLFHPPEIA